MSKDFFSDLQATSQKLAAVLLGQMEDARQKELQELNKQRDSLHRKRLSIESQLNDLQRQHSELSNEIDQLNGNIREVEGYDIRAGIMGGTPAPVEEAPPAKVPATNGSAKKPAPVKEVAPPAPKPDAPKTLRMYVLEILTDENRAMSLTEITQAVLDRGYSTKAKDFSASVKSILYDMKERETIKQTKDGFSI